METIAAIATPPGTGGIGVLRISGDKALAIGAAMFRGRGNASLEDLSGYRALYGRIVDGEESLDDAVALVFRAPRSYTGEDTVEFSCHGGVFLLQRVLRAALRAGARMAEPGEFSKRAFLNGKLSLTQAEAIPALIAAGSEQALRAAGSAERGSLYRRASKCKQDIVSLCAQFSAAVDFPDDDVGEIDPSALSARLHAIAAELEALYATYDEGVQIREGVRVALAGRPNVGKSSLMNLLAGEEVSIVTHHAGTTRDTVETSVVVGETLLRLRDTAGFRESADDIERIAIERAREQWRRADIVLAVFDASEPLQEADRALMRELDPLRTSAVLNKCDLPVSIEKEVIERRFGPVWEISALRGEREPISRKLEALCGLWDLDPAAGMLMNERQRDCVRRAWDAAGEAMRGADDGLTPDVAVLCCEQALDALMELTGERVSEAIVDAIFEQFCVGK